MRTIIIYLALTCAVLARPEDNRETVIKRLGKPIKSERKGAEETLTFKSGGYAVTVTITGSQSTHEEYTLDRGADLTAEQVERFLSDIGGRSGFTEMKDADDGSKLWELSLGVGAKRRTYAAWSADKKRIILGSKALWHGSKDGKKPSSGGF